MRLRADGPPAAEALGEAHQNCDPSLPSPKGIGDGTAPLHGAKSASSAWRGGGIVTAPCASTLATNTKAKVARTIGVVATIAARASIIAAGVRDHMSGCAPRGKGKMAHPAASEVHGGGRTRASSRSTRMVVPAAEGRLAGRGRRGRPE